jgi:hypothetical protein
MQSQFIAKYKNSHLVIRKYKTCHNSSRKIPYRPGFKHQLMFPDVTV